MAVSYCMPWIRLRKDSYWAWSLRDPIISDSEVIIVTDIPGWWRWRKTRMKVGDGKTRFSKLRYI